MKSIIWSLIIGIIIVVINMIFLSRSNYKIRVENKRLKSLFEKNKIDIERKFLESILEDSLAGYWEWNLVDQSQYLSNSFKKMFGYEEDEMETTPEAWKRIIFKEDLPKLQELLEKHISSHGMIPFYNEIRFHHKDGSTIWVICSGRVIEWGEIDNKPLRMVGSQINITSLQERQEKINYLSYHDQLTGLYNRRFFEEEITHLDIENNLPYTIAMVDVNGLKLTNDAFGHVVGDEHLKRVGNILNKEFEPYGVVTRIGGDEFVALLPNTTSVQTEEIVNRIYQKASEEKLEKIIVSMSIGFHTKTSSNEFIFDILKKAEENMYDRKIIESQVMRNKTIQVILKGIHEKSDRIGAHSEKVSLISKKIGEAMKLDHETIKIIESAGFMHDIGKITISESIINKQEKELTEEDYIEIKRHSECGYQILRSADNYTNIAEMVLYHHERWDGKGYPRGIAGENIPLISRIIAIADAFEVMTNNKIFKNSLTEKEALEQIIKSSGTCFDPSIVDVFCGIYGDKVNHNVS